MQPSFESTTESWRSAISSGSPALLEMEFLRILSRYWDKVDVGGPEDCWNWTACTTHFGYGNFWNGHRLINSHRFSWVIHHGPITNGLWVLHKCDNPKCCNPAHLELGTPSKNLLDACDRGRKICNKPICANGHEMTPENSLQRSDNRTARCRICGRTNGRKSWFKRQGKNVPPKTRADYQGA